MVIFDGREYIGPVDIDGNDIPSKIVNYQYRRVNGLIF